MSKPVVLIIMDGWGLAPPGAGNAVSLAKLSAIPELWKTYPHAQLRASGQAVGLPDNEDGNTEAGHINIGAGRIVLGDLERINQSIQDQTFYQNPAFIGAIRHANTHQSNIHLMGLISDAGVHSSKRHLCALLELIKRSENKRPVFVHLFTDGRDSPPQTAINFIREFEHVCEHKGNAQVATLIGRYYAMDRDRRWYRTEKAYDALTIGAERTAASAEEAMKNAYAAKETDEFLRPTVILGADGKPLPRIADNDAVIFFNFRIDRPRQLTRAFIMPDFETRGAIATFDPHIVKYLHKHLAEVDTRRMPFTRKKVLTNLFFVTMTEYEKNMPSVVAFSPHHIAMPIGKVIAKSGLRQLHMAETEKERFVTYYFNGLREDPFPGEDRIIIPSVSVKSYDQAPEMSAKIIADRLIDRLNLDIYSFIIVNFANADMVAHTGNIPASVKACETVDFCVGAIANAVLSRGGTCVITADHGNVEEMLSPEGGIDTEHSTYPVPFIFADNRYKGKAEELHEGILGDIAPTILEELHLSTPPDMTGKDLLSAIRIA